MKYLKLATGIVCGVIIPILIVSAIGTAQLFKSQPNPDRRVNGSVYASGKNVVIRGIINGDVFCAGQTVEVQAVVNGDVLCAARSMTIGGQINGNVRLAGNTVSIKADIDRNATIAGNTISLLPGTRVGRDLTMTGSSQTVRGQVGRDFLTSGRTVVLGSVVGRNVQAHGTKLELNSDAAVGGDLQFSKKGTLTRQKGSQVQGSVTRTTDQRDGSLVAGFGLLMYILLLAGLILLGLLLAWLFPRLLRQTNAALRKSILKTLLIGLLASIIVPILIVLLALTVIGIPVAIPLLLAWLLIWILSGPVAAYSIGRLVLRDKTSSAPLLIVVGAVILAAIYLIPFVGMIIMWLACLLGIGALLLVLKDHLRSQPPEDRDVTPAAMP